MEKIIYKNITIIILLILLISCADIINSDNTAVVVPKKALPEISKWLEYRFKNDALRFYNNDTTVLWSAIKPSNWAKTFYIVNVSTDSIYTITNLKLSDGNSFSISPASSFPIKLLPNQADNKNLILINLNTQNSSPGIYIDKVIVNDNPQIGFYIRVYVNN